MGNKASTSDQQFGLLSVQRDASQQPLHSRLYDFFAGTEARTSLSIFAFVLVGGVILGVSVPNNDPDYPNPWRTLSSVVGWVYFVAWSVSFYPQVILNYQRKSVKGLSFEYQSLNLLGFSCYTAYNAGYYWNDNIRAEYAAANNGSMPAVQANDVFFAIHAVALTAVVLFQIAIYPKGGQKLSRLVIGIIAAMTASAFIVAILVAVKVSSWFTWLNYLLYLSYIKLAITLMKYTPQAYLNWKRKSTKGWTIHNVLLDFVGGSLSVVQLCMDCGVKGDWSGAIGDPVKFGLGFTSMVFDIVYMVQHYYLYKDAEDDAHAEDDGAGGFAGVGTGYRYGKLPTTTSIEAVRPAS